MHLEKVHEFLAEQVRAWQEGDEATISQAFAAEGYFLAPGFRAVGPTQIGIAAREYFSQFRDLQIEVRHIWWQAPRVALEWDWTDTNRATGEQLSTREAVMIDFDDADKVTEWREYFNRDKPTPALEDANSAIEPV